MHGEPGAARPSYRFGPFAVTPAERCLTCHEAPVPLPPKLFDLLLLLVRQSGRLVSRERIAETIWPDVVVNEANLRQKIWLLRRVLRACDPDDFEYIETVPRHGYRFLAAVSVEATSIPVEADPVPPQPAKERPRRRLSVLRWLPALAVTSLLASERGALPPAREASAVGVADPRQAVAILRLRTHSRDPNDGWIADAFTEMLRAELEGSAFLRLVPAETIEREARDLSPPRVLSLSAQSLSRLRERLGGDMVVAGSLVAAGPEQNARLRVDVLVQCTRSRAVVAALTHSGFRRDLPELATRVARDLRRVLAGSRGLTAG